MADMAEFEERMARQLRAYATLADSAYDAGGIAAAAVGVAPRQRPLRVFGLTLQGAWLALLLLTIVAGGAVGAIIGASNLLPPDRPLPRSLLSQKIAFLRDGDLYLADPDGSHAAVVRRAPVDELALSRIVGAGSLISVLDRARTIKVYDADGSLATTMPAGSGSSDQFMNYSWAPGGKEVVALTTNGRSAEIAMYAVNGAQLWSVPVPWAKTDDGTMAWSPDGKAIAMSGMVRGPSAFNVWIFARDGSGSRQITALEGWLPRWSPDGRLLAVAGADGVWIVEVSTGTAHRISELDGTWIANGNWPTDLAWSPDGTQLAAITERALWTMRADGGDLRLAWSGPPEMSGSWGLRWQPDGRHVVILALGTDRSPDGLLELDTLDGTSRVLVQRLDDFDVGR